MALNKKYTWLWAIWIIAFGVMTTPALVVDGVVKVVGTAPGVEAVKELLSHG